MSNNVLVYSESLATKLIYRKLIENNPTLFSAVIELPSIPKRKDKKKIGVLHKLLNSSLSFIFFQLLTIGIYGVIATIFRTRIKDIALRTGITYYYFDAIDTSMCNKLIGMRPNYIFNASSFILTNKIISIPKFGILNFHCAPLPEYRGAANYFWMLLDDIQNYNGTFHYVDTALDTGEVISYGKTIQNNDIKSVFDLWLKIRLTANDTFMKKVDFLNKGIKMPSYPQDEMKAKSRSFPRKQDLRKLKLPVFRVKDIFTIFKHALN